MADGRKQMVGLLLPSDLIGRPGRATTPYDVTAVSDVTLCCFRRKPFESLLVSTPAVAEWLLDMSLDELDAAREWMLVLGRKTAREKDDPPRGTRLPETAARPVMVPVSRG